MQNKEEIIQELDSKINILTKALEDLKSIDKTVNNVISPYVIYFGDPKYEIMKQIARLRQDKEDLEYGTNNFRLREIEEEIITLKNRLKSVWLCLEFYYFDMITEKKYEEKYREIKNQLEALYNEQTQITIQNGQLKLKR